MKKQLTEKSYNGWSNYETWLVSLWIDNEKGSQEYWQEQAQAALNYAEPDSTFTKAERAAFELQDQLRAGHEEIAEQSGVPAGGFAADLFNSAMLEVNWHEIATSLLEDCEEEEGA